MCLALGPPERSWQEADGLRAAHRAGCALPVKVFDLAEFDLHLDLVPVNGLREQLDMDALLMGDLKSILVDSYSGKMRHYSSLTPFGAAQSWLRGGATSTRSA